MNNNRRPSPAPGLPPGTPQPYTLRLLIMIRLVSDKPLGVPSPPSPHLVRPRRQREAPVHRHDHARQHIDNLEQELQKARTRLLDEQQNGLNVVLDKDAGDVVVVDGFALLGHGKLVGEDGVAGGALAADGVDGRNDGEVVLELVEVVRSQVNGEVEGVLERGVKGAKGELVDDVGKVEGWNRQSGEEILAV